ncbi:MAG: arylsulfatase [Saprospiraceae bacterium]|nr:arylsulfatase [Saprospiraceae bacterium]
MIPLPKWLQVGTSRYSILWLAIPLLISSCGEQGAQHSRSEDRPNVILILSDDQGYGDFGCHGNPYVKTPHMDTLFSESVRFTNFHVDPTCAPTRAALMTGRYASRVGVWKTFKGRHHLREDESTMANVFQDNGYRTAIFGKWHLGDNYPFRPMDRGFEESYIHGGGVIGEAPDYWGNDYYDDTYFRNGEPEATTGYCTDVWFDEAKKFISKSKDNPFFIYLPLNAPHGPFRVPRPYVEPYLDHPEIPESRAWMYGMIASIDENLGDLRRFLEENGLADNTLLLYMTDNGTAAGVSFKDGKAGFQLVNGYNAGMRGRKTTPFEGGHRSAFAMHWPARLGTEATSVPALTAHLDVLPTLIDLLDFQWEASMPFDGQSLRSLLETPGTGAFPDRTLFVHNQVAFGKKAVGDQPQKYLDYCVMTDQWRLVGEQLFDIRKDPGQLDNVAAQHPEKAAELKVAYENWWEDIDDQFDEYCRTIIGSPEQEVVQLDCQFWHGEKALYNQRHVRNAQIANGFWDLKVAQKGTYQMELRRWPRELDLAMDAPVPTPQLDPEFEFAKDQGRQLPSRVLRPVHAKLKVGRQELSKAILPGQKAISFEVELAEGETDLQTWLRDESGQEWGAYYVYIYLANK